MKPPVNQTPEEKTFIAAVVFGFMATVFGLGAGWILSGFFWKGLAVACMCGPTFFIGTILIDAFFSSGSRGQQ